MKKYSAIVRDGKRVVFVTNQEYPNKAQFVHDLRANGYQVDRRKVKAAAVFDYIISHTNCNPWDWELTERDI